MITSILNSSMFIQLMHSVCTFGNQVNRYLYYSILILLLVWLTGEIQISQRVLQLIMAITKTIYYGGEWLTPV